MTMIIGDGSVKKSDKQIPKQTAAEKAREAAAKARALGKGAVVFQLTKGKVRTHIIKARCIAIEKGQSVALRYIKGVKQILESNQNNLAGVTAKAIVLREGKIVASDDALKEYLRRHPNNVANGGRHFYEYNPVAEADKNLKTELARDKAKFMAAQGIDPTKAYQIAKILGISNIDKLADSEIRIFLRNYANDAPEDFNELIESPEPEMNDVLMKAIGKGIVEFSRDGRALKYKGGGDIVELPALSSEGQIEHIIRWGMVEKVGEEFFKVIRDK